MISDEDTVVIVGTETTLMELVTTGKCYKFLFKHPAASQCNKHNSECGFLLKVTPTSQDDAGKFNIELITDDVAYPVDLHCHKDVISGTHIHLVVEGYLDTSGVWCNTCISWRKRPEYTDKGDVEWSGYICDTTPVRFVVYYDVRQCNTQLQR